MSIIERAVAKRHDDVEVHASTWDKLSNALAQFMQEIDQLSHGKLRAQNIRYDLDKPVVRFNLIRETSR